MHKLMILVKKIDDIEKFETHWPKFLALAEAMPGLKRETTSWSSGLIYGDYKIAMIHELYFDTLSALQQAMESSQGQEAGRMLQQITGGQITLMLAHHLEDDLENIQSYRAKDLAAGKHAERD